MAGNVSTTSRFFGLDHPSEFKFEEAVEWMGQNWQISVYASVVYLVFIFVGQYVMKSREAMNLRRGLILWNLLQATFSGIVAFVILPEFLSLVFTQGFPSSVCTHPFEYSKKAQFWGWLFLLSKLADLFDTVFLVFRKKKLIFLHWYHHVTALIVGFHGAKEFVSVFAWYGALNSLVHTLMYAYYGLMAMGVKVPKPLAMTITVTQMAQMAWALIVILFAYYLKRVEGVECHTSYEYLNICAGLGFSYLILFANYFYMAYVNKVKKA